MVEAQQAEIRRLNELRKAARRGDGNVVPMVNETEVDVSRLVALIRPLANVRRETASGRRQDERWTAELKDYLKDQPEGERELWDREVDPPIGVGLVDEGGVRWVDMTDLPDAVVLWAARSGLLKLEPAGYDSIAAIADVLPLEFKSNLRQFRDAVHQGGAAGAGRLVLLPRRGD